MATTLDELLSECYNQDATQKTASANGQAEKTASAKEGAPMGLTELYMQTFGDASEKTAAHTKTAEDIYQARFGKYAGISFDAEVEAFLVKFAAEDIMAQSDPNGSPAQLPTNKVPDAAAPINMTPQYADAQDPAAASREILLAMLQNPRTVSDVNTSGRVDLGAERPAAQMAGG